MIKRCMAIGLLSCSSAFAALSAATTTNTGTPSNLSAAEIVSRNVAARGGLQAWRAVQAISFTGKLGAGGNQRAPLPEALPGKKAQVLPTDPHPANEVQLPFVMEMARPLKVRFELQFKGQTAVQVYDGANGWKLRPFLNRLQVEPYTAEELKRAASQAALDGPLVDYAAKGTQVALEAKEPVEGHDTYKLRLTMKDGDVQHIWIDARTFLEAKVEGQPRRLDGLEHSVEVYYRDFHAVGGLQIPYVMETRVLPAAVANSKVRQIPVPAEQITIEKVVVNPKLDATAFTKPSIEAAVKPQM